MKDRHQILHCKNCGWISDLDIAQRAMCLECGYKGYDFRVIFGTLEEIKKFKEENKQYCQ